MIPHADALALESVCHAGMETQAQMLLDVGRRCCARRSFDCITREPGEGTPTEGTEGFSALLSALEGNCAYPEPEPAAAARRSFSAPAPLPAVT